MLSEMNRRNFFRTMIGGVAATAAVRTWPFRVYSFPSEVQQPRWMVSMCGRNTFLKGDLVAIFNASQSRAWQRLAYRIAAVDAKERTLTIEKIEQSTYNWQGLARS
jgi:hypothetical protein